MSAPDGHGCYCCRWYDKPLCRRDPPTVLITLDERAVQGNPIVKPDDWCSGWIQYSHPRS